ncbi:dUTP diphosphatase [Sporosarcina sp. FSL K6-1508]|uniref:dUTP diphosphatase n=1 Tax=Sporosarcina sp. FSL K6-1508 TaxID=2921553 RepID=UPI0030FAC22D
MNLTKLFEMQKVLDERIVREKGLEGRDTLPEKILALQVELGECANEWRGFKFWSEDREPRKFVPNPDDKCASCDGTGLSKPELGFEEQPFCHGCDGCGVHFHNPLLEEYVDCLHFILSIGNDLGLGDRGYTPNEGYCEIIKSLGIKKILIGLMSTPVKLVNGLHEKREFQSIYSEIIIGFQMLGELLGFTPDQIEQAYYAKNEINHVRQQEGY